MAAPISLLDFAPLEVGRAYNLSKVALWYFIDTGVGSSFTATEWVIEQPPASLPPTGMTVASNGYYVDGTPTEAGDFSLSLLRTDRYNTKTYYNLAIPVVVPGSGGGDPGTPGPAPEGAAAVAELLGVPENPAIIQAATAALPVITSMARAYTRANGFTNGAPNEDLRAVIQTATARFVSNPEQVASTVGGVTVGAGFSGWSLAELAVLNRYRKRAQ